MALLEAGADPGTADTSGSTPLHLAARWGWTDCVVALIGEGRPDDADEVSLVVTTTSHVKAFPDSQFTSFPPQ